MPDLLSSQRPLTIAHRAANRLSTLGEAFAVGVDYAEADVWFYRGRLEVRHDKTAGPLPILWDRWTLKPIWTRRLSLEDLLDAASGKGRLFLDLKGRATGMAEAVARSVERARIAECVAFSSPVWDHLDRLGGLLPQVPRFYTIGTLRRLRLLRPRLASGKVSCVSIDADFLTQTMVARLKESGVGTIVSWHVETPARVRRLLSWGVSGVTSDSLSLLASIRNGEIVAPRD